MVTSLSQRVSSRVAAGFVTIICILTSSKQLAAGQELNSAERWVMDQVTRGGFADLEQAENSDGTKKFPSDTDRVLHADFLAGLLSGTLPEAKLHRNGVRISGATIDDILDLTNAHIVSEIRLIRCQFRYDVFFTRANFAGMVSFNESVFKAPVSFARMRCNGTFSLVNTVFEGSVTFRGADILGQLLAENAAFRNKVSEANFIGMKIGESAIFQKAVFEGSANFLATSVGADFAADEAQFKNAGGTIVFDSLRVARIAFFRKVLFEGNLNFVRADVSDGFTADHAHFNAQKEARFDDMKVGGTASFKGIVFGSISFADSSVVDLLINSSASNQTAKKLDLGRAIVKRQLKIENISVQDFDARFLRVEGPAIFLNVSIEHSADFSFSDFSSLSLSESLLVTAKKAPADLRLQGLSFKYATADPDESVSHSQLLQLADRSAFSADVYRNLEAFFERQGYAADADRAFIAGRRRDRDQAFRQRDYGRWVGGQLLDWLVGYGRHPWQAAIPSTFFVMLGCFLFSSSKMEQSKPDEVTRHYNPFWYSLGLFLPIVNLQSDAVWKPRNHCRFLRHYVRVHILLGWILIPMVVAALAGLIK